MKDSIPSTLQEMIALQQQSVSEEVVATAIAGVIKIARAKQQTFEDLQAEVLADDNLLNRDQRVWLSELLAEAWQGLP
ncbi:MAG: hypothetical protein WBA13_20405 [Microcoleaceae cyanobacterium]